MFCKVQMAASDLNFTTKFWLFIGKFSSSKLFFKMPHHRHFLVIFNHRKSFGWLRWALQKSEGEILTYKSNHREVFLENTSAFNNTQIVLLNIVPLR